MATVLMPCAGQSESMLGYTHGGLQSDSGRQLERLVRVVFAHWQDRSESFNGPACEIQDDDDLEQYNRVPFRPGGIVKVRYVRAGRLHPRRIPFDD